MLVKSKLLNVTENCMCISLYLLLNEKEGVKKLCFVIILSKTDPAVFKKSLPKITREGKEG